MVSDYLGLLNIEGAERLYSGEKSGRAIWLLGMIACLALPCYLAVKLLIPLSDPYMAAPQAELIKQVPFWSWIAALPLPIPQTSEAAILTCSAIALVLIICYTLALVISRWVGVSRVSVAVVGGGALLLLLSSLIALPNVANTDLFLYAAQGRVFTVYHANPLTVAPATFIGDPLLKYTYADWTYVPSLYGPAWTAMSIIMTAVAGDGVVANLFAFRLLLLALNLGNAALIWKILGRLNPDYRLTGLVFYCWNPIVVLVGLGHVDPMIVFFLLGGVYLYLLGHKWVALVAIAVASTTKFVTAPLLVMYLFLVSPRKVPVIALFVSGLVGGIVLLLLPDNLFTLRRMVFVPAFGLAILWAIWQAQGRVEKMLRGWAVVMVAFTLLFMPIDRTWYLITLLGAVSLVSTRKITVLALVLSASALLIYLLVEVAGPFVWLPTEVSVVIWYAPACLLLLWMSVPYIKELIVARPSILHWGKGILATTKM